MLRKKKKAGFQRKPPSGCVDIPEKLLNDFTRESIQFYRQCFAMYDTNKDGLISSNEMSRVSAKLGYKWTKEDIEKMIERWDRDHDGKLSFEEFVRAMPGSTLSTTEEEHKLVSIRQRFREFDRDGSGEVTFEEAHAVLKKELAFTRDQSWTLFRRYDTDQDNRLNYNEFCKFYHRIETRIDWVRMMFGEYDKDGSGSISTWECKKMLRKLKITDVDVETLIQKHDTSGDGSLQYEEFVAFLMDQTDDRF